MQDRLTWVLCLNISIGASKTLPTMLETQAATKAMPVGLCMHGKRPVLTASPLLLLAALFSALLVAPSDPLSEHGRSPCPLLKSYSMKLIC